MENWLIVGLGNPGASYEATRHNFGFMLVDLLAARADATVRREECRSLMGRIEVAGVAAELAKPQTFMNLSGDAVGCLLKKSERARGRMIVVSDDLAIPFGSLRLRPRGSHGGHNGLRSVISSIGTDEFIRLRIGISPDHPVANTRGFVLEKFSRDESAEVEEILKRAADAVEVVIERGIDAAMGEFNQIV